VEYNERHDKINLVLFDDALEHLTRLHRVLRMRRGHVMIVGVGGSGKQSLLRLAAFAAGNEQSYEEQLSVYRHCGQQRYTTHFETAHGAADILQDTLDGGSACRMAFIPTQGN